MLVTTRNKYVSKKNSKMREKNIIYRKEFWQKIIQFDPRALLHEYSKYYGKGKIKETSQPQVEK